jgi:hypothetical protein
VQAYRLAVQEERSWLAPIVEGEIRLRELDLQEVLAPSQMQGAGFREGRGAAFEEIGDVLATKGLEDEGILDRAGDLFLAIDFT